MSGTHQINELTSDAKRYYSFLIALLAPASPAPSKTYKDNDYSFRLITA
jgi:hypothetical protein